MKVCTDACLFGAWVTSELAGRAYTNALDIGTGTGLLSLMLAQANEKMLINAVELDKAAAQQATDNFNASPFLNRLKVQQKDIREVKEKNYDLIISNPPFYEKDLKSEDDGKNAAKHDTQLTLAALIGKINDLLAEDGIAALLLPYHRLSDCESLLRQYEFHIHKKLLVHQSAKHAAPFRVCWIFARSNKPMETNSISIKDAEQQYTQDFVRLLKPYYLKL